MCIFQSTQMKLITNLTSTPKAKKSGGGGQRTLDVKKTEKKAAESTTEVATGKENEQ